MTNRPSPLGATIPLYDLLGNAWTEAGGVVSVNGTSQPSTHGVTLLMRAAPSATGKLGIWQQTSLGFWEALSINAATNIVAWGSVVATDPRGVIAPPPVAPPPVAAPPPVTPPVTTPPPAPTPTLVLPKFGVHLGSWLGGGAGTENNVARHVADFEGGAGKMPDIVGAVLINSYQDVKGPPSSWGGDTGSWTKANGLPIDGSVVPLLFMRLTDGETTDTDYAGWSSGKYDAAFQAALASWMKVAPFPILYIRINPEFNSNFLGGGVPSAAQVANWNAAQKHVCNVAHSWGNTNKVNVRMVWCPDTSGTINEAASFGLPVMAFFPMPDAAAVNKRYFDVIGGDLYWAGYPGQMTLPTTPLAQCTDWSFPTFVAIAQAAGCNVGLSENGDTAVDNFNAHAAGGAMDVFASFVRTMQVPLEFVVLWDINGGVGKQISGGGNPAQMAKYKALLGSGGTLLTPPPI